MNNNFYIVRSIYTTIFYAYIYIYIYNRQYYCLDTTSIAPLSVWLLAVCKLGH